MTWKPDPKPEPRSKKKRKRIPYMSDSRKLDQKLYESERKDYLEANPECERCIWLEKEENILRMILSSDQIHHRRGRIGSLLYNPKYFMACCNRCHKHIEANPKESFKMGWSVKRTGL